VAARASHKHHAAGRQGLRDARPEEVRE
jgi:hypothetical protein